MRDKGIITVGILVFLGLVTFPIWYNLASGAAAAPPTTRPGVRPPNGRLGELARELRRQRR